MLYLVTISKYTSVLKYPWKIYCASQYQTGQWKKSNLLNECINTGSLTVVEEYTGIFINKVNRIVNVSLLYNFKLTYSLEFFTQILFAF